MTVSSKSINHEPPTSTPKQPDTSESTPILIASHQPSPESNANIFSKVFFSWARPLFQNASSRHRVNQGLELEDLLPLKTSDYGCNVASIFEDGWKKQFNDHDDADADATERNEASIAKAIRVLLGRQFILAGLIKGINSILQFTFPLIIKAMLKFIEDTQSGEINGVDDTNANADTNTPWYVTYRGYWLSVLLFLAMASKAIAENSYFHLVYRAAFQTRTAISVAVYNKALRLSSAERHGTTLGEMINLMQVDASKVEMFIPQFHVLWDGM